MIPDVVIGHVARAILAAEHPEASGWSGKPEEVKDHYRRLARAALKAAEPETEGFVGVCCEHGACFEGGYYPPGGWTPVNDDGREFVFHDHCWYCPTHAEEAIALAEANRAKTTAVGDSASREQPR